MHWISAALQCICVFLRSAYFKENRSRKTIPTTKCSALIARNCSEHYKCACCIAEYVRNTWHKELSDEELVFLTIHLKRIRMGK